LSPITRIVTVLLAACFIVGVVLLYRSCVRRRGAGAACTRCGHSNPTSAKFCALCGATLGDH